MLIPKKNRVAIYEYLFKEGVMVAKKDFNLPKHPELEEVPNLHVIKAMQVLCCIHWGLNIWVYLITLVTQISWICNGTVRVETLLLVSHK